MMEFTSGGRLIYQFVEEERLRIIQLTYEITDGVLITTQPSSPSTETTAFRLHGRRLELTYEGLTAAYVKQS